MPRGCTSWKHAQCLATLHQQEVPRGYSQHCVHPHGFSPHVTNLEGNRFGVGDDKGGLGTVDTADWAVDVNLAALVGEIHVARAILLQACKEAWNGSSLQLCNRRECRKREMNGEQEGR